MLSDLQPATGMPIATGPPILSGVTWYLTGSVCPGDSLRRIPINVFPFRIGRRPDLKLTLPVSTVSKVHAEFIAVDGRLRLRDLASTNGTFLNGQRIDGEAELAAGDLVQLANIEFRVECESAEACQRTMQTPSLEQAWQLTNFERLLQTPAVIPHFQPVVHLPSGVTIGYEVLARSELAGLETAGQMFALAEQLNMEVPLSVLCREVGLARGFAFCHDRQLFLNTHPSEDLTGGLLRSLRQLRASAPSQPLTLEIHEAAITDPDEMQQFGTALKELNIRLAYDDFGAGQARLLDLVKVPPDYLKFDISLVGGLHAVSKPQRHMVATLVDMVRGFGIAALAEGVECAEDAQVCRELGFDYAQGYFFGRPAPAETFTVGPDAGGRYVPAGPGDR